MDPRAKQYYLESLQAGSINPAVAKRMDYDAVPGGLDRVMRIAKKFGAPGTVEDMDRSVPIRNQRSSPFAEMDDPDLLGQTIVPMANVSKGKYRPEMSGPNQPRSVGGNGIYVYGGRLTDPTKQISDPNTAAETVAHEVHHTGEAMRGTWDRGKWSEGRAGPMRVLKVDEANRTGNVASTLSGARALIKQFRAKHERELRSMKPNEFYKGYSPEYWLDVLKDPKAARQYLKTVQSPGGDDMPKVASMSAMSSERRYRILEKLAEERQKGTPLIRSDAFDPAPAELVDRRSSLGSLLNQRFGNLTMGDRGPSWQREIQTPVPSLSLTSERPVDLRLPATYGAKYQIGDSGAAAGMQYTPGMGPSLKIETPLGEGHLSSTLRSPSAPKGLLGYMLGANYSYPLKIPGIKNPEISLDANVGGRAGAGAPISPSDYNLGVTFGGEF